MLASIGKEKQQHVFSNKKRKNAYLYHIVDFLVTLARALPRRMRRSGVRHTCYTFDTRDL